MPSGNVGGMGLEDVSAQKRVSKLWKQCSGRQTCSTSSPGLTSSDSTVDMARWALSGEGWREGSVREQQAEHRRGTVKARVAGHRPSSILPKSSADASRDHSEPEPGVRTQDKRRSKAAAKCIAFHHECYENQPSCITTDSVCTIRYAVKSDKWKNVMR